MIKPQTHKTALPLPNLVALPRNECIAKTFGHQQLGRRLVFPTPVGVFVPVLVQRDLDLALL